MLGFIARLLSDAMNSLQEESLRRLMTVANPIPDWRTDLFFDEGETVETYTNDITEYGLLMPNGSVLWSSPERPFTTPAERDYMVAVLRKTADECGFSQNEFIANYKWVVRRVETTVTDLGTFALTDPSVVGESRSDSEDGHDDSSAATDSHDHDVRAGSLGGAASRSA